MHFTTPIFALVSLATAVSYSPTAKQSSQETTILAALAGTYSLLNTSSTLNNVPIPESTYGQHPVGLLIYTAAGFMSATITATEPALRPSVSFPYKANETDAEWALVGKHSIGYAGPLSINTAFPANETNGQVFHGPLTVANVPTLAGERQPRNYTIVERMEEGKVVKYLRIGSERGDGHRGLLWWKKMD
ncbi:Lipocalin-like domain-containing protein [Pyrenophora seminiperda CCB06]|uniref:Lipocalin-like domain-containing protein n=1 Tax=Pyrenophora seminiperda CCB06 TaxID=1302712 RepID=A0A3M7LYX6_9PLEO|nr:Lipocalin-like domain-containing protein [Pyrenophora seminiperda CCB06]